MRIHLFLCVTGLTGLFFLQPASLAIAQEYVAGTKPDQRPEGAPVIRFHTQSTEWHERALRGVSLPYPRTLSFLDNQGAWFNPFQHPGMTAPYDLRGYHKAK